MSPEMKQRWEEHKYALELNNFLLSLYHLRICAILAAWGYGMPDSEVSAILGVSPQYCAMIRSVRDRFPKYSEEELAQEVFNMVRVFDGGQTYKRDYSHFQKLDEKAINDWHILREKQRQFHNDYLNLDAILADAKHAYFSVTGKDIEWRETEEKPEQLEQQETELESEPDDEDDTKEMLKALNERVAQDEIICRMFREGAISEDTALKYTGGDLEHESFMKLVKIYSEEDDGEKEPEETPEQAQARVDMAEAMRGWVADERREERLEALFELVQDGTLSAGNAFEYVPSDYGLDFDGFLRMQEAWEEERTDG